MVRFGRDAKAVAHGPADELEALSACSSRRHDLWVFGVGARANHEDTMTTGITLTEA